MDLNIVLKCDNDMKDFLKVLIYELETIDGRRGTAKPLIDSLMEHKSKELRIKQGSEEYKRLYLKTRHQVMMRTYQKFTLLRFRLKLSFECLKARKTVSELILKQIIISFRFLRDSGQITVPNVDPNQEAVLFDKLMVGDVRQVLQILVAFNIANSKVEMDWPYLKRILALEGHQCWQGLLEKKKISRQ